MSVYIEQMSPIIGQLFADKFYVTVNVDSKYQDKVRDNFVNITQDGYAKKIYKGRYVFSAEVYEGIDKPTGIIFQCDPIVAGKSFFRLEYNPNKTSSTAVRGYLHMLLPGGQEYLAEKGIVTRVDASFDVEHLNINKIIVFAKNFTKSEMYLGGGRLESYYIGKKKGELRFLVYNKTAQITKKAKKDNLTSKHDLTRFEAVITKRIPFSALHKIDNPFKHLSICYFPKLPVDDYFPLFLDSVRQRGAQDALLLLPLSIRKKYKNALQHMTCNWWNPDDLWSTWPDVVGDLRNPPKSMYEHVK